MNTNKKVINKELKEGKKQTNISFAEFVQMSQSEYDKLIEKLGEETTLMYIDRLDNYKGSTGKRYKSDYRTILTWVDKDQKDAVQKNDGGANHGKIRRQADEQIRNRERSKAQPGGTWDEVESKFFG